ncbi:DUF2931 family protein [Geomonas sp. Red32]|uniref:DUF2931 family protein n=1 Tax=Geomonas sp. Red32 TaxID=2912856 RepID=UPI00202CF81D|nr:DUF2931 family protein [Geomonas sp. Red32]MCM0084227.1 DUF2931 family protein [Geomonas sp. Red32]
MARVILIFLFVALSFSPLDAGAWGIFSMLTTEKFDWLPTECAHRKFPMTLIKGDLILKDGHSLYVPAKAIIDNGWGELGSTHIVGETMKSLPVKLTATWFSYTENKFFSGDFELPYDSILKLVRTMISSRTGKKPTAYWFLVGFGPEGAVSVWVAAEGITEEVGNYKAKEVTLDWKVVLDNDDISRSDYINEVLRDSLTSQQQKELKEHGVLQGISGYYSKQYKYNLSVGGQTKRELWLRTLNGEQEYFDFNHTSNVRTYRGLPQNITVYWENKTGLGIGAHIFFDEAEINAAYKRLSAETGDRPMELKLEISDNPWVIHNSLNDGKYIILLNKTEVKPYSLP